MPKALKQSELLVGRRLPAMPTYFETLMAGFVKKDGTFCGKAEPVDSWMRPAHRKARKEGLITRGFTIGFGPGKPMGIWYLTAKGEAVATECRQTVDRIAEERNQWSRDWLAAHREKTS